MATEEQKLLDRIHQFCVDRQIPTWAFGKLAVRDTNFVPNLRRGRSPTLRTMQKIDRFIKRHG